MSQTLRLWHDPLGFQQATGERYGEPFTLHMHPVGPLVVVSDPESVHHVLTGDAETFRAGSANGRILPILECGSVLVVDGEEHQQRRHLLMPLFRTTSVTRLADTMVSETRRAMRSWPVDRPFSLLPSLRDITLEVILRAVIAVPDPTSHRELAAQVRRMLSPSASAALWLGRGRRSWWSPARVFERHRRAVHVLVRDELVRRRHRAGEARPGDVLDVLMSGTAADGAPLDDRSICDEVVTLLLAGHETTSTALAWAFERVLRHPSVLDRARGAIADDDNAYMDALIRESLRSRPPLVDAVRMATRPLRLGGRNIPVGAIIMVSIPLVHHRDDVYPDPEAFRPERFADHHPRPNEWVPFGGGTRRCLGADLAMLEMTKVIETVLARADLAADGPPEHARLFGTALVPSGRASVVVRGGFGSAGPG
jgi:cytochrome P450